MNNLNDIYEKFGKEFCLCPFIGGFYSTHNTREQSTISPNSIRPCSISQLNENFNIQNGNIMESVNSPTWQKIRKQFINKEFHQILECQACIETERQGGASGRHGSNQHAVEHINVDLIQTVEEIVSNNYLLKKILSIDYFPSNYCNYSCVMCNGGASSSRLNFEIQFQNKGNNIIRTVINPEESDFYEIIKQVHVINFTGGETVLQPQVLKLIDYLIEYNLAENISICLLSNASSFPSKLEEKFKKFKRVVYMCSVDGVGSVIEYQRRGADWSIVEKNVLKLVNHNSISTVVNYVLTAINAPSFMDFVDWVFDNNIEFLSISPVRGKDHLGVSVMPVELRKLVLDRLISGQEKYNTGNSKMHLVAQKIINQAIEIISNNPIEPNLLTRFIRQIRTEDLVSKISLVEVVPEWAPYFEVD